VTLNRKSDWARLFRIATDLIRQTNARTPVIKYWTFGGGTAMMLQIDHRESHDVDFFVNDPQVLAYLDPKTQDFKFEVIPADYTGDGNNFVKIVFTGIGEIDFIVSGAMTDSPTTQREIEGVQTHIETIPEIITKKIFYRGSGIRARDIFDIAAAAESHADPIIQSLRSYPKEVGQTLERIKKLNPDFVSKAVTDLMIRDAFVQVSKTAIERAREILFASL
jgi:hypothetical protein